MKTILLSEIEILSDRQRQEFEPGALVDLMNSIESHGLLHPVVVRHIDGRIILIAGERRIRAVQDIYALGGIIHHGGRTCPPHTIPVTLLEEISDLDAEEIELDENLRRVDLTWQEHAAAVARLAKLRAAQAEESGLQKPTTADIAKEVRGSSLGYYQDITRKEIAVAANLDLPEVAKAKSVEDAYKILKRRDTRERHERLAASIAPEQLRGQHTVLMGDCLKWMHDYSGPGFDIIITDPPYGMNAQNFGDAGGRHISTSHDYDDTYESWQRLMMIWTKLSFTVTKPAAHAYVHCDIDRFHELRGLMTMAGWSVFRTPITCVKADAARVPLPEHGPRRNCEWVLYAYKGKKPVNFIAPDYFVTTNDHRETEHGARKPVTAYIDLLKRSYTPGDSILDPFAGSGTVLLAGHELKCRVTAIEQSPAYFAECIAVVESLL